MFWKTRESNASSELEDGHVGGLTVKDTNVITDHLPDLLDSDMMATVSMGIDSKKAKPQAVILDYGVVVYLDFRFTNNWRTVDFKLFGLACIEVPSPLCVQSSPDSVRKTENRRKQWLWWCNAILRLYPAGSLSCTCAASFHFWPRVALCLCLSAEELNQPLYSLRPALLHLDHGSLVPLDGSCGMWVQTGEGFTVVVLSGLSWHRE